MNYLNCDLITEVCSHLPLTADVLAFKATNKTNYKDIQIDWKREFEKMCDVYHPDLNKGVSIYKDFKLKCMSLHHEYMTTTYSLSDFELKTLKNASKKLNSLYNQKPSYKNRLEIECTERIMLPLSHKRECYESINWGVFNELYKAKKEYEDAKKMKSEEMKIALFEFLCSYQFQEIQIERQIETYPYTRMTEYRLLARVDEKFTEYCKLHSKKRAPIHSYIQSNGQSGISRFFRNGTIQIDYDLLTNSKNGICNATLGMLKDSKWVSFNRENKCIIRVEYPRNGLALIRN